MTDHQFTEGDRVYHRQRREVGIYVKPDWCRKDSIVDFPSDDWCRVTTDQLIPADEVPA
ncbi:hypothetical protein [Actinoplanes rectilineatus]|uniref:hypothetical protein n=1 Tax=Actinoplanes rectilineatus TaxID=113571 RepID=UPI000AE3A4D5|nr:hypothetical protein [Actinoplanes rectilineatus]